MADFDFELKDLVFRDGRIRFRDQLQEKRFREALGDNERLVLSANLLCPPGPGGDPPNPINDMCGCVFYSLDPRIGHVTRPYPGESKLPQEEFRELVEEESGEGEPEKS